MSEERVKIQEQLREMVEIQGAEICLDHQRVMVLLLKHQPHRPAEVVALHAAVREGIAADLSQQIGVDLSALAIEKFARRIFDQTGIAMALNEWAVRTWANVLGRASEARNRRLHLGVVEPVKRKKTLPIIQPKKSPSSLHGHRKAITSLQFSPNGRWLASSSIDRTIRIWDGRSGGQIATKYGGHRDWIRNLTFRPDGERLASVGDDGSARIWNMKTGQRMHRLLGHNDWVRAVGYSHDGRLLVTGSKDGFVCIWEAESAELAAKLGPFKGEVSSVAFDCLGRFLIVGCSNRVELWDIADKQRRATFDALGERIVLKSLRDGSLMIGDNSGLRKIDPHKYNGDSLRFVGHDGPVIAMAIDPLEASVASAGADKTVRFWDLSDAESRHVFEFRQKITAIGLNKAGSIAVGFTDGNGIIYEMGRGA